MPQNTGAAIPETSLKKLIAAILATAPKSSADEVVERYRAILSQLQDETAGAPPKR